MKLHAPILAALILAAAPAGAQEAEPPEPPPSVDQEKLAEAQETAAAALEAAGEAKQAAQEAQAAADAATEELEALKAELKKKQEKKEEKKEKKKTKTFQGAIEEDPGLKIGARLYLMWALQYEDDEPLHAFSVNMARVKLTWSQWKLVEAVLKLDVDHLIMDASTAAIVRDVYVRIQPFAWLGLRIGQFKKPFSKVELTSRAKLPFINRGISNDWIAEELGYGDRDLGLQLEGRIWKKIKLDYMIGVFNGAGMNVREMDINGQKDLVFRLEARPVKWLSLGVDASLKIIGRDDLPRFIDEENFPDGYTMDDFKDEHGWMTGVPWMTGVDVMLRIHKMRILVENLFGESWWFRTADYRYTWSLALMLSYEWRLVEDWKISLEPALKAEMLTLLPRAGEWSARMWQIVPGMNLHLGKFVRVMINGEFVITEDSEPDESTGDGLWPGEWPGPWKNESRLLVQVAFSI